VGGSTTHALTAAQTPALQVPFTGLANGDPGLLIITSAESNGARNLHRSGTGLAI
jgi:hypothetical protein